MLRVEAKQIVNYCYLIYLPGSSRALLVDPAWDAERIESVLTQCGLQLYAILLTHHHWDHVNKADELARKHKVSVYMSRVEIHHYGFNCSHLVSLEQGHRQFGDLSVQTISTPGHTRGSVCYRIGNHLLTGDTLFIEGCGLCNENADSSSDMYASLARLHDTIPDGVRVYPGHRFRAPPGARMKDVRNSNPYLNLPRHEFMQRVALRQHSANQFTYL